VEHYHADEAMAIIRLAVPDDAAAVQAIYAPVVRDTAISFEAEPPSVEEMRRRIAATLAGFQDVGLYRRVGYKLGVWHDVMWWQLAIGAHPIDPPPPLSLAQARERAEWAEALSAGHP
jgi:L-amino acid N-acyltransferase YncA